jgi:uncharacterized protein
MLPERVPMLIDRLGLVPHPEGGRFGEVYKSASTVLTQDGRGSRSALTTITFLLVKGEVSAWHRVRSDEAWHFYEGDRLELTWIEAGTKEIVVRVLGPTGEGQTPVAVVPANCWQTARPLGAYTLVGCTVAPGFDYEDFELAD